jgi:hypothetical protein
MTWLPHFQVGLEGVVAMGIEVVVEDDQRTVIASLEDPRNLLHRVLPHHDDASFQFLNRVDWYGDTTFNRHQIPDVRRELKRLESAERSAEELDFVRRLDALAAKAEVEPHLYLKFYGD